jgi:hypothetical protein
MHARFVSYLAVHTGIFVIETEIFRVIIAAEVERAIIISDVMTLCHKCFPRRRKRVAVNGTIGRRRRRHGRRI